MTTERTAHTPTPWRIGDLQPTDIISEWGWVANARTKEETAFIVLACNAYDVGQAEIAALKAEVERLQGEEVIAGKVFRECANLADLLNGSTKRLATLTAALKACVEALRDADFAIEALEAHVLSCGYEPSVNVRFIRKKIARARAELGAQS